MSMAEQVQSVVATAKSPVASILVVDDDKGVINALQDCFRRIQI
jgi:hypothetical protein